LLEVADAADRDRFGTVNCWQSKQQKY